MWRDLFRAGLGPVTLTACLGEGVYALNSFLISTAMPVAVLEVGGIRFIAWSTTVYLVAAIAAGAAAGFLKARFGARRLLLTAAALFLAGTAIAGAARGMAAILGGRALQGAGEGAIAAACYALVAERLPPALVPKAFGLMAVVWAISAFGGPLLGGSLTELVSWRAAFLVNVPLIGGFALLVLRAVPADAGRSGTDHAGAGHAGADRTDADRADAGHGGADHPDAGRGGADRPDAGTGRTDTGRAGADPTNGAASLPIARLLGIAAGIMLIAVAAVTPVPTASAAVLALGAGTLAWVFIADGGARTRLFPRDAFRLSGTLGAGLWVVFLMPLGQAATVVYLPITIQSLWGYGPTEAGALVAVMALSWSGAAVLVALPRGSRLAVPCIRWGAILVTIGLAGAALAVPLRLPVLLVLCQATIGTGFGIGWAFLNQVVTSAARAGERDLASALVPTAQSAGYALGAALAGLIANASGYSAALSAHADSLMTAWIFGAGAAVAGVAVLFSLRLPRAA